MSPRRILLVISTTRYSKEAVRHAMVEAREARDAGHSVAVHVLYVIEGEDLERVYRSVGEAGFLGMQPQRQVLDALAKQHHQIARRRIGTARRMAKRIEGLVLTTDEVTGGFVEQVHKVSTDGDYDVVYLTRADRPFISRFLFGSDIDKVARLVREDGTKVVIDGE